MFATSDRGASEQEPDWGKSCGRGSEQKSDDDRGRSNDTNVGNAPAGVSVMTVQSGQPGDVVQRDETNSLAIIHDAIGSRVTVWPDSPEID